MSPVGKPAVGIERVGAVAVGRAAASGRAGGSGRRRRCARRRRRADGRRRRRRCRSRSCRTSSRRSAGGRRAARRRRGRSCGTRPGRSGAARWPPARRGSRRRRRRAPASKPGSTVSDVASDHRPGDHRQSPPTWDSGRQASQWSSWVDAEPGAGGVRRGGDGVVGEHDALRLARRAARGDDEGVAGLDGPAAVERRLALLVDDRGRRPWRPAARPAPPAAGAGRRGRRRRPRPTPRAARRRTPARRGGRARRGGHRSHAATVRAACTVTSRADVPAGRRPSPLHRWPSLRWTS